MSRPINSLSAAAGGSSGLSSLTADTVCLLLCFLSFCLDFYKRTDDMTPSADTHTEGMITLSPFFLLFWPSSSGSAPSGSSRMLLTTGTDELSVVFLSRFFVFFLEVLSGGAGDNG